jgi:integrase
MAKRSRRGRGEGSITFHEPTGLWRARKNGKTFYGHTKADALAKLAGYDPNAVPVSRLTVAAFLDQWLTTTAATRVQPSTLSRYRKSVRNIAAAIGAIEIGKLSAFHVEGLYAQLTAAGKSPRECQHCGVVLGCALKHAVALKLCLSNPVRDVPKPRVAKKAMQVWTAEQARRFLSESRSSRMHAAYVLALSAGMRMGELFGLRRADLFLDAAEPYLTVQRTLEEIDGRPTRLKEPKTAGSRRRILLPPFAVDALRGHLRQQLAAGYAGAETIFTNDAGGFPRQSDERRRFQRIVAAAGVPSIRFHDLRHSAATLLLAAGEHVKVVSERLGHASIQITMDTYAHVLPTMQAAAVRKIETALA